MTDGLSEGERLSALEQQVDAIVAEFEGRVRGICMTTEPGLGWYICVLAPGEIDDVGCGRRRLLRRRGQWTEYTLTGKHCYDMEWQDVMEKFCDISPLFDPASEKDDGAAAEIRAEWLALDRISALEDQVNAIAADVAEINTSYEEFVGNVVVNSKRIEKLEAQVDSNRRGYISNQRDVRELEPKVSGMVVDVDEHRERIEKLEAEQEAHLTECLDKSSHDYEQVRLIAKDMAQRPPAMSPALAELVRCARGLQPWLRMRVWEVPSWNVSLMKAVDALDDEGEWESAKAKGAVNEREEPLRLSLPWPSGPNSYQGQRDVEFTLSWRKDREKGDDDD